MRRWLTVLLSPLLAASAFGYAPAAPVAFARSAASPVYHDSDTYNERNWLRRMRSHLVATPNTTLANFDYDEAGDVATVTHFSLIVLLAVLASQGFSGSDRTGIVFCGRITALGSYACDAAGPFWILFRGGCVGPRWHRVRQAKLGVSCRVRVPVG